MELNVIDKVKEYVKEKYPKTFKKAKEIIVMENDSVYFISKNKDASPLIISKKTINEL